MFYEPSYFRMFQLPPPAVFKRSQQSNVELHGREMADEFCLKMPDFHVTFRDLLHAVNLWHGTNGFLLPFPRKACWGFFRPEKIHRLRSGLNPRTWVPKASALPLDHWSRDELPSSKVYDAGLGRAVCVAYYNTVSLLRLVCPKFCKVGMASITYVYIRKS